MKAANAMNKELWLISAIVIVLNSFEAVAHHGTVTLYDQTRTITLKGTVTDFLFKNPHVELGFDVDDRNGTLHWSAEGAGVYQWSAAGWGKNALKAGDQITITIFPAKDGNRAGEVRKILKSDGKSITLEPVSDKSAIIGKH